VTALWLWRQGRERSQFARALYALIVLQALASWLAYTGRLAGEAAILGYQLVGWGILLWGLDVARKLIAGILAGAVALAFVPFIPILDIATWGFLTAVPLAAFAGQRHNLPIITPRVTTPQFKPVGVNGNITADMIESQQPILECLADGVIFSGRKGLIEYANQAALAIIGLKANELEGHPVTDILVHLPMLASGSDTAHASTSFEMNGRVIQGQMNIVYDTEGTVQGTVAVLRDTTAQYQAEKTRDRFLTTVSHELRTPLTAIKGYVELMNSGTGGSLNDTQKSFLNTIQRNVNRTVQLINNLIFASAVRGGRLEYRKGGYADLPQLIQQISREMQPKAAKDGQQIEIRIDDRLQTVQADPIHIATILEELVTNGIKYNRTGGRVQIGARLELDKTHQQAFAAVSVSDEGIGIAPEDQAYIFEDFYRMDEKEEQVRAGGMGIGLSIVRALVEAYNGRIWFESQPDQGSTFIFIIPTSQPEHPVSIPAQPADVA
jgi:PAS domain S-box-containing protein